MSDQPDRAWIREVLARFERPLVRYAHRITGDLEAARDVVQDVLLRLHARSRAEVEPKLAEWLFTVCRNRALDVRRKEGRMIAMNDDALAGRASPDEGPAHAVERQDTTRRVLALIHTLPEGQQEVLRLRFEHGLSYQEIAGVTGHSTGNVGYLLHVAIKTLGRRLEPAPAPAATSASER